MNNLPVCQDSPSDDRDSYQATEAKLQKRTDAI